MFEHSLIDLETEQQPRGRRWISLPVAVALHLVAFTTFAFGAYWNVGTVPEPATNVAFFDVVLPPPPPPPSGGGHPKPQHPQTKPVAEQPHPTQAPTVQQPTVIPDRTTDTPPVSSLPEVAGPVTADPGPSTGPDTGKEGPDLGPGPGTGDVPGPSAPIHLTAEMTPPVAVYKVQPRYTEIARRAGIQGVVIVEAVVDEQGRVTNVRVLRHLPMGLDQAAIEAIQQWRFTPAVMQGRPVKVYFTLTANFTVQR